MTITIVLTEEDYLTYLLYSASKSKRAQGTRRKAWLTISGLLLVMGAAMLTSNDGFYSYYFFAAGLMSLVFYPLLQRYSYKKNYRKFVRDKMAYKIGKESILKFGTEYIETKDITGESRINTSEVAEINEIASHYFIRLKSGDGLVVPKTSVATPTFVDDVMSVMQNPDILVTHEPNWKWK
ncbi:hypothetical protein DYU05_16505 [Mucilaginibacter terrenus]|uniref:YcxB family protein n=1 Tax=Mucilaginibacter terrenus TaxID=2482727 RepID=A0A3E2NML2_9SPHI|nr:YcxB family protein [Mucilaginibacter terrenus]RFZ82218.1 hypothetical protein DYU05_16505 [Mucilaginibacter terrenus]